MELKGPVTEGLTPFWTKEFWTLTRGLQKRMGSLKIPECPVEIACADLSVVNELNLGMTSSRAQGSEGRKSDRH